MTTKCSGVDRPEKHSVIYIPKRDLLTPTFWNRSLGVLSPPTCPTRVRQTGKHASILIVSDLFELMIEKLTKWKSAVSSTKTFWNNVKKFYFSNLNIYMIDVMYTIYLWQSQRFHNIYKLIISSYKNQIISKYKWI